MIEDLEGRVVLITGASTGIGAAAARAFGANGARVAVHYNSSRDQAEAVVADIRAAGGQAMAVRGDVTSSAACREIVSTTIGAMGRLDVLVNNAAARELTTMREITVAEWDRTLRVCLTAPAFLARWAAAEMPPGGVIVNIGSMMSRQAHGVSPAYIACKGAIESLTYDLAALYGPNGIRVVTVAPGAIDTAMSRLASSSERADAREDDPVRDFSESMTMLGRWGHPEEVARAVAWVASPEASYLTGTTLVLDGGWSRMHMPPQVTQSVLSESTRDGDWLATGRKG